MSNYESARIAALRSRGTFCVREKKKKQMTCFMHMAPGKAREFAISSRTGLPIKQGPLWVLRDDGTVTRGLAGARRKRRKR